jgi:hypothetical protein
MDKHVIFTWIPNHIGIYDNQSSTRKRRTQWMIPCSIVLFHLYTLSRFRTNQSALNS